MPYTLEGNPYAPLSLVSEYLKDDPKCDSGNKLKVQNHVEIYYCEFLKIDKVCTHIVSLCSFDTFFTCCVDTIVVNHNCPCHCITPFSIFVLSRLALFHIDS